MENNVIEVNEMNNAVSKAQKELWEKGPFFQSEMGQYTIQLAFEKGSNWRKQQIIEKTIDWLDSIMDYVSEKDKRLVCNFTNFDELVNDFKKAMKEE